MDHEDGLLQQAIDQLDAIEVINKNYICLKDIRFSKYCNILFDHMVYDSREAALDILKADGIIPIGRFGRWEYLWSDQAFLSGYNALDNEN